MQEKSTDLSVIQMDTKYKDVYGRILIHLPSNTITTGCNNPSKGRFVHPWLNHGMTLRHAARLQSFPDWFDFHGSSTEKARQIGNAVPPLLGKVLISDICSGLRMIKVPTMLGTFFLISAC